MLIAIAIVPNWTIRSCTKIFPVLFEKWLCEIWNTSKFTTTTSTSISCSKLLSEYQTLFRIVKQHYYRGHYKCLMQRVFLPVGVGCDVYQNDITASCKRGVLSSDALHWRMTSGAHCKQLIKSVKPIFFIHWIRCRVLCMLDRSYLLQMLSQTKNPRKKKVEKKIQSIILIPVPSYY